MDEFCQLDIRYPPILLQFVENLEVDSVEFHGQIVNSCYFGPDYYPFHLLLQTGFPTSDEA